MLPLSDVQPILPSDYRLVLGMPNQNDLLGELKSMQELDQTSLTRACLDFSPISRCNKNPE
jgi:hypothetical protein